MSRVRFWPDSFVRENFNWSFHFFHLISFLWMINFISYDIQGCNCDGIVFLNKIGQNINFKVYLTQNTIWAQMLFHKQPNWISFEQPEIWYALCPDPAGEGLFPVWRHILFCMHVHKEWMPCKWVCDITSGIEPDLASSVVNQFITNFQLLSVNF